jgi:membrane-bound serine protease (ClpP class)
MSGLVPAQTARPRGSFGRPAARALLAGTAAAGLLLLAGPLPSPAGTRTVAVYELDGGITPPVADWLSRGITDSNREGTHLIVVLLDTPGGLDASMRVIVREILNSSRPVAVFVAPRGARAASAGVFLTMAAGVAAMAPGTNIGAAHPVGIGGGKDEKVLGAKVENDAVAYLRSIAGSRGRDADWAEKAVRESVSVTGTEAVAKGIVDLVAADLDDLLTRIDGREVPVAGGKVRLETKGATIVRKTMSLRWRALAALADPNISYVLMMLGTLGLFFELAHPGAILPGVVGGVSLVLGFYGLQTLPLNYAGLALIFLAVIMFIAEIKVTSYGMLTVGGVISLLLGSLMLIDSDVPYLRISTAVILATVAVAVTLFVIITTAAVRAYRRKPVTGREGLIGATAHALSDLSPRGKVFIHGEIWEARCPAGARKGDRVRVIAIEGLTLTVEPQPREG